VLNKGAKANNDGQHVRRLEVEGHVKRSRCNTPYTWSQRTFFPTGLGTFKDDPSGCVHVVSFSEAVYI
jgi:hypothetical protein